MRLQAGQPVRPYVQHEINAGNPVRIEITSLDWDNELEAPSALRYRIDNLSDVVVVQDWTTINTPATKTTLTIAGTLNAIYSLWRDKQLNQVTFEATYADGTQQIDTACYQINQVYSATPQG